MQRIRRVGVLSLGKMLGALYALLGLIFGAIFTSVINNNTDQFNLVSASIIYRHS